MYNKKDTILYFRIQHYSFTNIKKFLVFPEEMAQKFLGVQSMVTVKGDSKRLFAAGPLPLQHT